MTGSAARSMDPWTHFGVVAFATALAFLATLLPGRLALAGRPADVIGSRQ